MRPGRAVHVTPNPDDKRVRDSVRVGHDAALHGERVEASRPAPGGLCLDESREIEAAIDCNGPPAPLLVETCAPRLGVDHERGYPGDQSPPVDEEASETGTSCTTFGSRSLFPANSPRIGEAARTTHR